jgi:hypothetical protein
MSAERMFADGDIAAEYKVERTTIGTADGHVEKMEDKTFTKKDLYQPKRLVQEGMDQQTFTALVDEVQNASIRTLVTKNARYSTGADKLHNFRRGAEISGMTMAQTCWGYLAKHLTALRDMVEKDDFSDREDFLEKCKDSINYLVFLWCIGNEGRK